jgi:hypothetical protein
MQPGVTPLTEERAKDIAQMLARIDRGIYVKRVDRDIRPNATGWYIQLATREKMDTLALYSESAVLDYLVERDKTFYKEALYYQAHNL